MENQLNVGVIGCGNIFPQYVKGCGKFPILNLAVCADMDFERAQERAENFGLQAQTVDELLANPEIDLIINLTNPAAHTEVSLAIIGAGKHVYSEKPFALNREDGQKILSAAKAAGVRVGCAPDTFLGGGLQTCRKLIEDGAIGQTVAAVAFFANHGPESWHPNPAFYYKKGAGPLFDMGPYYITALVQFLGAVQSVSGVSQISQDERIATSEAANGLKISVDVPTHVSATLQCTNGVATLISSFDVWGNHLPRIEIYGTEGTISCPDPNIFGGIVQVWRHDHQEWDSITLTHDSEVLRGIGVADMAHALRANREHRASGDLGYHVLDVMLAVDESSKTGRRIQIQSQPNVPTPLPAGLEKGVLDG